MLRQPIGPSRGSSITAAPSARARSITPMRSATLDVRQPQGVLAVVFDDAAVDPVAELQRQVAAVPDLDRLRGPAEQPRVEVRSAREVAGVEL
jgi:hypothetical protein